jgi:predicted nucleotide-binding protein
MATELEADAYLIIKAVAEWSTGPDDDQRGRHALDGQAVVQATGLSPDRIDDAVDLLDNAGHISATRWAGTSPFGFGQIELKPSGRLTYQKTIARISVTTGTSPKATTMSNPDPRKVFIIHGRNTSARIAIEHFLRSLNLQPIDFDELAAAQGGTAFVGDIVRAGLEQAQGIVALFTPDEYSALRSDQRGGRDKPEDIQRWQARPNVIFEAGMAYGIAPKRTVLVTVGTDVALFSDVNGVHIVRLDNGVNSRGSFRHKLMGMGCEIDKGTHAWTDPAQAGDFEACITALQEVSPRDPFC